MRKLLIGGAAAALLATPAAARDKSGYFGAEGGALWAKDLNHDLTIVRAPPSTVVGSVVVEDGALMDFKKPGLDLDLILGYDFGIVRLEGELGYKRASLDSVGLRSASAGPVVTSGSGGNVGVTSAMANLLLDFGNDDGLSFYAGPGAGWARVKMNNIAPANAAFDIEGKDSGLALQGIAGIRYAITPQLDIGLKYRYFRSSKLDFDNIIGELNSSGVTYDARSRFKSHSVLFSIIYNFAEPAAPPPPPPPPMPPAPPPPPPPPATQTCPDGSVVLATDSCPVPPPPPPPPPPAPERG
ncbi:outer membrane beta-barrel protein [Sphingomonas sp. LHG3406-1]|uniref:outer membrane protein n=1 Tax=Sphingomonas sp. LHG3406-1 TaxID=2804617 RepID=UPI002627AD83|nr:outer membrane beta-barrel protein [Sphingomonas sp. LHG3406-1]